MSDEPSSGEEQPQSLLSEGGEHQRAQRLAGRAAIALTEGNRAEALSLYREAAALERVALASISPAKTRTYCLLAVSAASLLYKSRQFEAAERMLYVVLARQDLPGWAFRELRDLLDAVRDSQALPIGCRYGDRSFNFTMRGQSIGNGTAPIDLIVEKGGAISRFITRGVEWASGAPIRTSGSPREDVRRVVEARVTQPSAGSYRFSIKLVEPEQLSLIVDPQRPEVTAARVGDTLFSMIRQATSETPHAAQALRELVPEHDYRSVMLGLLRSIVPTESQLSEVEVGYEGPGLSDAPTSASIVRLAPSARGKISRVIAQTDDAPPKLNDSATPARELRGRLRALNLDNGWFAIVGSGGIQHSIKALAPMDDILGPLVNKNVVARVLPKPGKRASFQLIDPVRDLDLDESLDSTSAR